MSFHNHTHPIPNVVKSEEEMANLRKVDPLSKTDVIKEQNYVLQSRLSFTEVQLKGLETLTKWSSYESAAFEQPLLCTCCPSFYFKFRYAFLWLCRKMVPCTSISFGKTFFFFLFLVIAGGVGYLCWGSRNNSGDLACLFLGLAYAFPTRNSVWLGITSTPFERVLFWHKMIAVISVPMGIYHGIISGSNSSGILLVALMALLVVSSFWPLRIKYFEFFYRSHWVLFLIAIPIAFIHGASLAMIGVIFWLLDVLIRFCIVRKNINRAQSAEITQIPPGLVKICFSNEDFKYKAGQYVFLCVPALSIWEWHPFSLSSSPNEKAISLHTRVLGDWTKRLYELSGSENAVEKIWIDGPYGNCRLNLDSNEYNCFILVSGGIGITPMQSICNQLIYEHLRGREMKKIMFIWSVKDRFLYDEVSDNPEAFYVKKLPSRLPYSFQPDVLIKHEHEHVLESFFHLTNIRKKEDFDQGNIIPSQQHLLKFGRPNLPSYFDKMKKIADGQKEGKVAVLCCGPEPMMVECKSLAMKYSFDFHQETFNF